VTAREAGGTEDELFVGASAPLLRAAA
jgi:hypothetical protein